MQEIEIELPWPPSLNTHKAVVRGRMIMSKKGREYIKACAVAVNSNYGLRLSDELTVEIDLYPPDKRRRDIDNYTKAIFDAMTDCKLWLDDSQVKRMIVNMHSRTPGGRAVLRINSHAV